MIYRLDKTMGEIWEAACAGRPIVLRYFNDIEANPETDIPDEISQAVGIYCSKDDGFGFYDSYGGINWYGYSNTYPTNIMEK